MDSIEFSQFDSDAFQVPFYRVKQFDSGALSRDLAKIATSSPFVIDAKVPASDIAAAHLLQSLGFRKVCMQITLTHELRGLPPVPEGVELAPRLELSDDLLRQHARNFRFDRFSIDPLLPREGTDRLYFEWVRNSLTGGRRQVVHAGPNFCTFSMRQDGEAAIDLVSVLEPKRGIGKRLLACTIIEASGQGAGKLHVTTECENQAAWSLYLRTGFVPSMFTAAFHLVKMAE